MLRYAIKCLGVFVFAVASGQVWALNYFAIIEWDYTGNYTATDRFWFYKNLDGSAQNPEVGDGVYPSLEYEAGRAFQVPGVVYSRGTSLAIALKFKNIHPNTITADLDFTDFRLVVPKGPNRPSVTYITLIPPVSQQFTVAGNGGTTTVNITVSGIPNYVTLGTLEWKGTCKAVSGVRPGTNLWAQPIGWASWEKLYLTQGTPTSHQDQPWTDLLDISASFAHGENTVDGVAWKSTFGLFFSQIFAYNLGTQDIPSAWVDNNGKFKLKELLARTTPADGNCVDVSFFSSLDAQFTGIAIC